MKLDWDTADPKLAQICKPAKHPNGLQNAALAVKHDDNIEQLGHFCIDSVAVWHDAVNAQTSGLTAHFFLLHFFFRFFSFSFLPWATSQHTVLGLALKHKLEKHLYFDTKHLPLSSQQPHLISCQR